VHDKEKRSFRFAVLEVGKSQVRWLLVVRTLCSFLRWQKLKEEKCA
jgi:hypothetical protein